MEARRCRRVRSDSGRVQRPSHPGPRPLGSREIDPATGKTIWTGAFPKSRSNDYASPLIAGDKLYAPREDGIVFVASIANDQFEVLSENNMDEPVIGSPVPASNRLLIRGEKHLFCIASEQGDRQS